MASIVGIWQPDRHITVMAGMDYCGGVRSLETINSTSGYKSSLHQRFKGECLKPFTLFSWTIRKNSEYQIDTRMPVM